MNSTVFPGVEAPADPVDGVLCDALMVALRTIVRRPTERAPGGEDAACRAPRSLAGAAAPADIAEFGRLLRAELRRMDIELVPVVRLEHSRRRSDMVALSAYTLALAQRNWALGEIARLSAELATMSTMEEGR